MCKKLTLQQTRELALQIGREADDRRRQEAALSLADSMGEADTKLTAATERIATLEARLKFERCDGCSTGDCPHDNVNDCVQAQAGLIAEQECEIHTALAERDTAQRECVAMMDAIEDAPHDGDCFRWNGRSDSERYLSPEVALCNCWKSEAPPAQPGTEPRKDSAARKLEAARTAILRELTPHAFEVGMCSCPQCKRLRLALAAIDGEVGDGKVQVLPTPQDPPRPERRIDIA